MTKFVEYIDGDYVRTWIMRAADIGVWAIQGPMPKADEEVEVIEKSAYDNVVFTAEARRQEKDRYRKEKLDLEKHIEKIRELNKQVVEDAFNDGVESGTKTIIVLKKELEKQQKEIKILKHDQ